MKDQKAEGFNFLLYLLTLAIIMISYVLTLMLLDKAAGTAVGNLNFMRASFIFLAPCALEGIALLVSEQGENKAFDTIELVLSALSMIFCIYLAVAVFAQKYFLPPVIVCIVLAIYPLKFASKTACSLFKLLDIRRKNP